MMYFYYFMAWTWLLAYGVAIAFAPRGKVHLAAILAAISAAFFVAAELSKL